MCIRDSAWSAIFTYATDLFDRSSIERFSEWFVRLLEGVLTSPDRPVGDVELLAPEHRAAVVEGSVASSGLVAGETIADQVAARVADSADGVALVSGERSIDYAEFGLRVAGLARTLIGHGVGPNTAVGVVMRRTPAMVIAVHAVMAAGGQYVPIDPEAPADRARYMVETAAVGPVLVESGHRPSQVLDVMDSTAPVIEVDADVPIDPATEPLAASERLRPLRLDDAAYTLFTSGSTGRPKGVTVSHGAVVNRLAWMQSLFGLSVDDVVLWKTPVSFDVSVWELFWPLMVGASVVVAEPGGHRDPWYVASVVERFGVSVCHFVPWAWCTDR